MLSVFFFNIAPKKIVLCNVTSSSILVSKGYDADVSPSPPPPPLPSNPSPTCSYQVHSFICQSFYILNCKTHSVLDIFYVFLRSFFSSTDEQRASDDNGNLIVVSD